jgi:uncharacterized membrane protein YphA (DoxX/SURF4 family)
MDTFEVRGRHISVLLLHPYVSLFSRLVLGGIFLFAGIIKLPHIETLIWEIEQYQILPEFLVSAFGYTLPTLEITLGTLLVFGIILRASTVVSGLLVISFTIAKLTAFTRGLEIDVCPCFGPAMPLFLLPSLAIDFVLLMMVIQLLLRKGDFLSVGSWLTKK